MLFELANRFLTLRRRQNESVTIHLPDGRAVVVHVINEHARLRIEAPQDIKILRSELQQRAAA